MDLMSRLHYKLYLMSNGQRKSESPIFLLGNYRGGTTLLQRVLNSVDGVAICGEQGAFMKKVAEAYFLTFESRASDRFLKKYGEAYDLFLERSLKNPKKWSAWANWYDKEIYKYNYRKFVKSFFAPSFVGGKYWGFKEISYGDNDRVLEFLKDLYPQAKFIFLIRNAVDLISSQLATAMEWPENQSAPVEGWVDLWNRQNGAYYEFYKNNKEQSFMLRYEDLISQDMTQVKELFAFLRFTLSDKQREIIALKEGRGETAKNLKVGVLKPAEIKFISERTKTLRQLVGYA